MFKIYIELRANYVQKILDQILSCKKMLYLFLKLFNTMMQISSLLSYLSVFITIHALFHSHQCPSFIYSFLVSSQDF